MKHWNKQTMVITQRTDWGYKQGYCKVCGADMAIDHEGKVSHYQSHKNIRRNGVTITRVKP